MTLARYVAIPVCVNLNPACAESVMKVFPCRIAQSLPHIDVEKAEIDGRQGDWKHL